HSTFTIARAQAKVFGGFGGVSPNDATLDGSVGISSNSTGLVLVTAGLHERTHAMGRGPSPTGSPPGLGPFRLRPPGRHVFGATTPQPPSYFSIDGGVTRLADFGQDSDPGDFLAPPDSTLTPNDVFDEENSNLAALTGLDQQVMDVLGFHRASLAAIDHPPL